MTQQRLSGPALVIWLMVKAIAPWAAIWLAATAALAVLTTPAASAYIADHAIELLAAACAVVGTVKLARNRPGAGWGFVWYLASNAGWIVFALQHRQWPLLAQQVVFIGSSVLGVWLWLVKPARLNWRGTTSGAGGRDA